MELNNLESYIALRRYSPASYFTLATQRKMYETQYRLGLDFFATYPPTEELKHG
jgi:hypothetical protein